jgi:hypothetical protein
VGGDGSNRGKANGKGERGKGGEDDGEEKKVKAFSKFVFQANNIKYPVLNDSVLIIKVIIMLSFSIYI